MHDDDDVLPGALLLLPQEVAGGRRGTTCQSPVNHPLRRGASSLLAASEDGATEMVEPVMSDF